jgi:hypothetical protein
MNTTVTRLSPLSGVEHTLVLPLSAQELEEGLRRWRGGELIQNALPGLTDAEREFLKTGITPAEWAAAFPEDE